MGIKKMQGTSAQLEYIGPTGRKHRKTCTYYKEGKCYNLKTNVYLLKCVGRIQCGQFVEMTDEEKLQKQKEEKKNAKKKVTKNKLIGKKANIRLATGEVIKIELVEDGKESAFYRRYSIKSQLGMVLKNKKKGESVTLESGGNKVRGVFLGFDE